MNERLLMVDDDVELCELLSERLKREGYMLEAVHDGVRGLERARSGEHSLVILDLMLPGVGGLELLRKLRQQSGIPVLILTARGEEVERVLGLEIGADDYLPKPFSPRELLARIRAILRRTARAVVQGTRMKSGDLSLDPQAREAWMNHQSLDLTSVEFSLLEALLHDAGRVVTRERLTEIVLGRKLGAFDRVIDVHVSNLRKKLGDPPGGERIKTVRGVGYQLAVRSETNEE
jgi:two-component system response regulator CpxR